MVKISKRNSNSTEGAALANLWRAALKDLKLMHKLQVLIDVYINKHKPKEGASIALRKKNKTSITNDITAETMTWKTFLNLVFNVLKVKKMDIVITLHHENKTKSIHKTTVTK